MISTLLSCLAILLVWAQCYPLALLLALVSWVILMKPSARYQGPFDDDLEPVSYDDWMQEYYECRSVPSVHVRGLGAEELSTLSTVPSVNQRQRSETQETDPRVNSLGSIRPPGGRD